MRFENGGDEFLVWQSGLGGQDTEAGAQRREEPEDGFSDRALVRYVGLCGAVAIDHVRWRFGVGRTAAYRHVARCVEEGLLERIELLREEPTLLRATAAGLRHAGLDLPVAHISPGSARHWLRCASVGVWLAEWCGWGSVVTEREIRRAEQEEGGPLFSAKVGENPDGSPRLHRPDLAILNGEFPVPVEVELSPKSPKRLAEIMRGWRRASWVGKVMYLCEPGRTHRAVSRAAKKAHISERVVIGQLTEVPWSDER